MIRYYICEFCDHRVQKEQKPDDPKRYKKCPACKRNGLYQDLSGVYCGVREVKTLGQVMERNTKKLGTYGLQAKEHEEKERQKQIFEGKQEKLKKAFPKAKLPKFEDKSPIPETPGFVKKAIESQTTEKKKAERAKKYILEGK
jgi:hypothetical protein